MAKKLTYEEVKNFIEVESGSGCKLLSKEYKDLHSKIVLKCKCGKEFITTLGNFEYGGKKQCNKCSGKHRYTYLEADNFLNQNKNFYNGLITIHNNKHDILSVDKKIKTIDLDGYMYSNNFNSLRQIKKLRPFSPNNKYVIENIKHWLKLNRKQYQLISDKMLKSTDKLHFVCDKGHDFYMKFNNMLFLDYSCPVCAGNKKYTYEEVKQLFHEKGYTLISKKYKNSKSELEYMCNKHSELGIQKTTLNSFNQCDYICKGCLKEHKRDLYAKTQNEFENEVYELVGDEYTVLGEYVNTHTKILMLHNECNSTWEIEPNAFLSDVRCPSCSVSSGENKIKEFLNINNIKYSMQVKFDNCKNIRPLPFDFSVTNKNNKLLFLIEYDGEGHYEPYRYGDKDKMLKKLKRQQYHDNIKNQYCKDNNIPLIRIPYWQFDKIEEILNKWLIKYGLIHKENIMMK